MISMDTIRGHLILNGFEALGTKWWIETFDVGLSERTLSLIGKDIRSYIDEFEKSFSRFNKGSEVYQLNQMGRIRPSERLYHLVSFAEEIAQETSYIFNPFLGLILDRYGYGEKEMRESALHKSAESKPVIVRCDEIILPKGLRFDPGGFGKGYLIAEIGGLLMEKGIENFLINGGGDMYLTSDQGNEIEVILSDPIQPTHAYGMIYLKEKAFASSSSIYRSWVDPKGIIRSHLIDPRDAEREIKRTSYVIANEPAIADIAATLLAIIDYDTDLPKINNFLEKYKIAYLLIDENGRENSKDFPKIHDQYSKIQAKA